MAITTTFTIKYTCNFLDLDKYLLIFLGNSKKSKFKPSKGRRFKKIFQQTIFNKENLFFLVKLKEKCA